MKCYVYLNYANSLQKKLLKVYKILHAINKRFFIIIISSNLLDLLKELRII